MAATDDFSTFNTGLDSPYGHAAAVTPHDTNELSNVTRAIYVGGAGNLKVTTVNGEDVTFNSVPAGTVLRIRTKKVFSTGSTATNIVAIW